MLQARNLWLAKSMPARLAGVTKTQVSADPELSLLPVGHAHIKSHFTVTEAHKEISMLCVIFQWPLLSVATRAREGQVGRLQEEGGCGQSCRPTCSAPRLWD